LRKLIEFLKEVQVEFKFMRWPSKDELIGLTSAVIVFSIVLSVIVGVFDVIFSSVVSLIP